ncbi:hypothetical protein SAY87_026281 [Trapa incisa]|uniref:Phototropic-responsive NPH3 family protein n=1 Tax=Trapa incisa TaxID=236973 RepID=A0AAN7GRR5_9MYRT|nr:hypothetical protein SAY87_026281 [Trapa incisa]
MKFMKLGSKPDSFQAEGDNIRYVATELATDIAIIVGDVKFCLHKFPLLSKSARLQKLVSIMNEESGDEIQIGDIPGGPAAFEVCIKFCYGMTVTLNAYNVVATRCAAEYLEMYESVEKGNLIYKIEVFLSSSIFRSWKDSIIVLQTTRSLHPWSDELKIVNRCLDSIALKASMDTSKVDWSYTYNRKKLPSENGSGDETTHWNGMMKQQLVPRDWWVEDICDLQLELYKRVIATIKMKGLVPSEVIGEALQAYALRRLPGFSKGVIHSNDVGKHRALVETILRLLPLEKGSVSCGFMLRLLRAAVLLECSEVERNNLMGQISLQLDEASVGDLLFRAPPGEAMIYDVDTVEKLVEGFVSSQQSDEISRENEFGEIKNSPVVPDPRARLVKLVDSYLAEISRDQNLPCAKFVNLATMVSGFPRLTHDGIYRAIDMYLKEHPEISKSDKKRICKLMDCSKLSADACLHAVQNERLPLRVVVQVLFFEQARASTLSAGVPMGSLLPAGGSHGSSRSAATTNTEDEWEGVPTHEEIRVLKGQLAALRLSSTSDRIGPEGHCRVGEKAASGHSNNNNKMKGLLNPKIFFRLWSSKDRQGGGELSSSDTSDSPGSGNAAETKLTPSRSRRHSVS